MPKCVCASLAGVGFPAIGQLLAIEFSAVDLNLVANGFSLALGYLPVTQPSAHRADTKLAINPPRLRVALVFVMIENGDVTPVIAAVNLHPDVQPHGAFALGPAVRVTRGVYRLALDTLLPRHAHEESAVGILADGHVGLAGAHPLEVEHVPVVLGTHRPALGLGEHRVAGRIEQIVNCLPLHRLTPSLEHLNVLALPVIAFRIVEIVTAIHAGEPPVDAGLMLVMPRAVLGKHTLAVRTRDRVQVWPVIGSSVLSDHRLGQAIAVNGYRAGLLIKFRLKRLG